MYLVGIECFYFYFISYTVKIGIQQQRCNKLIVPMVLSVLFGFITLMLWIISVLTYDQGKLIYINSSHVMQV